MSSNHSYQSPESRKDEFRRYLEKSGAIESLTTVLVGLYEETDRPPESTEYIRRCLSGDSSGGGAVAAVAGSGENEKLKKENAEMKTKIKELNKTIETLRVNLKHAREEAKNVREEVRKMKAKGGSS
jgi:predicted RNase H-like nuclease (RuvC/YqgF family)